MNKACLEFGHRVLTAAEVTGKTVIEVGSLNVNGSLRDHVMQLRPASYVGVDIQSGPGVDEVCNADDVIERFGRAKFDLVLSTEVLEHVQHWRTVVSNLKQLTRPGGTLLVTTRSLGFPFHGFPFDFWRYELEDFRTIFSDLAIQQLEPDTYEPGVFLKATRPLDFKERALDNIALYSMVRRTRVMDLPDQEVDTSTRYRMARFAKNSGLVRWIPGGLKRRLSQKFFG